MSTIENLKSFDPFAEAEEGEQGGTNGTNNYIHIRLQQRNGRKTLTTVQGIPTKFDQKKILKVIKKKFACNGTIVRDTEMGEVIQLQGDQRKDVQEFLVDKGGLDLDTKIIKKREDLAKEPGEGDEANATSVTRNLRSTFHSTLAPRTMAAVHPSCHKCGLMRNNSARNVNAHRNPHQAAGAILSALLTRSGIYQHRSTPKITATRGCKRFPASADIEVEMEISSSEGDGGGMYGGARAECVEGTGGEWIGLIKSWGSGGGES
ncbi:Eukaryotic translation initiation factor eIF-1 [Myotisia sp. PD_48]|nr:Eukaryotic translation initiation factor eIF-1 [Myotisia sp. PD_48]